jgi:MarR family transcriptional regulator, 2-MHQ and catechol-resistance regulon repressor
MKAIASTSSDSQHDEATRLYAALADLVRVYQFRDRDRICCHDISVTQCYALETLVRLGPRTLNELATEMYLDKSTTSRVVTTLERKGYVVRQQHPRDKRSILVDLTASGRRLHTKIERDLVEETRQLLQDFEPAVREAAPALLTRLARAAERRTGCAPTSRGACCP